MSNTRAQEADPLGSAALCTKRFHRAVRKTLVELSHINDRVVRDYVHWKKKNEKMADQQEKKEDKRDERKTERKSRCV